MPTPIETLKKIEYSNIEQFLIDVNRNFAVIENSPLYKGIPGKLGDPGLLGLKGVRGTKFIFVTLSKFQAEFTGQLSSGSQITADFINSKLLAFENKQKLQLALGITEFVDKDIIVLTNTIMLSYDFIEDKFVNTGVSFNEQSNLLNNIQTQIENYVEFFVNNNSTITNLSNIFEGFPTYGKNYADTNNTFITSTLTQSSVYSPYISGYNSNIGIPINNHKYFGFSDSQFPKDNNGSIIFGSMKKYYDLLMATISTDQNETLTSDYSPGVNNIPSGVFMQDTENSGIMFGFKGRNNLKRFGNIYKNDLHEIVIKSDSGINPSEFSKLIIHKDYLKFDKIAKFGNDLEVSRDTRLFGDIQNEFIKTGKFTNGANVGNNFNTNTVEFGKTSTPSTGNTYVKNLADFESYSKYVSTVFVTDANGLLLKNYGIENTTLPLLPTELNPILETINSPNKILTSHYFGYLARKINVINSFITNNYWKKNQFETGEIPSLWLANTLKVTGNTNLTGLISTDTNDSRVDLLGNRITFHGNIFKFNNFANSVLVTGPDGVLSNSYSLETSNLSANELIPGNQLNIFSESTEKLLTSRYYAHLAKKINSINTTMRDGYWTKAQFETFDIPKLYLSDDLFVMGNVTFAPNSIEVFKVNKSNNEVIIGYSSTKTTLNSSSIKLAKFLDKVLVTDSVGNLIQTYGVETAVFNDTQLAQNTTVTTNLTPNVNTLAKGYHIGWLTTKINNVTSWISSNFWSKNDFLSGVINTLWLNTSLRVDGNVTLGNPTNPNISTNENVTVVGKIDGNTTIKGTNITLDGKSNIVPVTDANGLILNTYSLETQNPNSSTNGNGTQTDLAIETDYWNKAAQPQNFDNVPTSSTKILTSKYFLHIIRHFKAVRKLMFDRPTYAEIGNMLNSSLPHGAIFMWTNTFGPHDASLYTVCDGSIIPNSGGTRTPNMVNKFIKGSLTPNVIAGNQNNNQVTLWEMHIPPHSHAMPAHTHSFDFKGGWDGGGVNNNGAANRFSAGLPVSGTTGLGGGGYTYNQRSEGAESFSIEPNNYSVIFLMKNPPLGWINTYQQNLPAINNFVNFNLKTNWVKNTNWVNLPPVYRLYIAFNLNTQENFVFQSGKISYNIDTIYRDNMLIQSTEITNQYVIEPLVNILKNTLNITKFEMLFNNPITNQKIKITLDDLVTLSILPELSNLSTTLTVNEI